MPSPEHCGEAMGQDLFHAQVFSHFDFVDRSFIAVNDLNTAANVNDGAGAEVFGEDAIVLDQGGVFEAKPQASEASVDTRDVIGAAHGFHDLRDELAYLDRCFGVDGRRVIRYLRKEAVNLPADTPKGYVLVTYRQVPIGWEKNKIGRASCRERV